MRKWGESDGWLNPPEGRTTIAAVRHSPRLLVRSNEPSRYQAIPTRATVTHAPLSHLLSFAYVPNHTLWTIFAIVFVKMALTKSAVRGVMCSIMEFTFKASKMTQKDYIGLLKQIHAFWLCSKCFYFHIPYIVVPLLLQCSVCISEVTILACIQRPCFFSFEGQWQINLFCSKLSTNFSYIKQFRSM